METEQKVTAPASRRVLRALGSVLLALGLLLGSLCFFSAWWYLRTYGNIGFDSVLFTLTGGLGGVSNDLVKSYLSGGLFPAVATAFLVYLFLFFPAEKPLWVISVKEKAITLFPFHRVIAGVLAVVIAVSMTVSGAFQLGLPEYLIAKNQVSDLYQKEYKDPAKVNIRFPEQKRNLVYIMLESMETSYLSQAQGGAMEKNLIPELYALAKNNLNFSHNSDVGGFREMSGGSWTIGAMVGHTAGIPLKVPEGILDWQNGYGQDGDFLPGVTNLTNILEQQGYYQALMVGSDAGFGGRRTYYTTHGVDKIYDIYTAWRDGTVNNGYWNNWWGFEDYILFDYAKKELTKISEKDQPFAFTMLTVDTHHIGGFTCKYCENTSTESYENAISCSSKLVAEFVSWLQQQPFYENTTVIITGDHCSMDGGYFNRNVDEDYTRHVYNCFINSAVSTQWTKNRQFCAMDMFPTTLAAMGCTIEGNRLGLGTNLFSNIPTLMEKYGYYGLYNEVAQSSDYYKENFYTKKEEP